MEIQQHDGVVVEVAGIPAGLRQAQAGERGVTGGRGRRQGECLRMTQEKFLDILKTQPKSMEQSVF